MSARWITVVMANGTPDVAVRDDENVARVVAERQRHYDEIAANRGVKREVHCIAFPVLIVDEKDNAYS